MKNMATTDDRDVDSSRYPVRHVRLTGADLAYVDAGKSGAPVVLLVHGWPETKRIWWRNIEAVASAGFRVLAPDLRGFGDSSLARDGFYDVASHSRDLHALVAHVTGAARCIAVGGDLGGVIIQDLGARFPGFVARQVLFNCPLPYLKEQMRDIPDTRPLLEATDYFIRQGTDADALAAELADDGMRRRYVATFYSSRFWAAPGTFDPRAIAFMVEPFADGAKLRASFTNYETVFDPSKVSEKPLVGRSEIPTVILFGPHDRVIYPAFDRMAAVVFQNHVGPFSVRDAGHFMQWEAASVLNSAVIAFCSDLKRHD